MTSREVPQQLPDDSETVVGTTVSYEDTKVNATSVQYIFKDLQSKKRSTDETFHVGT